MRLSPRGDELPGRGLRASTETHRARGTRLAESRTNSLSASERGRALRSLRWRVPSSAGFRWVRT
eukprot:3277492-Lingulodinium_polyedra.AAC.1